MEQVNGIRIFVRFENIFFLMNTIEEVFIEESYCVDPKWVVIWWYTNLFLLREQSMELYNS